MLRRITVLAAGAAIAISSPAVAAPSISATSGTPLASQIYGIDGTGTQVFGSSPSNDSIPNVTFTGDTTIHVGSGFAQINDADYDKKDEATQDWYQLIINPDLDFTDFKFSTMLTDQGGTISVYALLAGTALDATDISNFSFVDSYSAGIGNLNQLLSGATFDAFAIQSSTPIEFFEVKQMSYNAVPGAVPEPGTWALMLLGFAGVGAGLRRSRRRRARLLQIA